MSILQDLNPHKQDVVRIKFKTIDTIMRESKRAFHDTEEYYHLGDNVKAILQGGDFVVKEEVQMDDESGYITVQNHLDHNYSLDIHDEMVESIELVQDAERFISNDHGLIVIRVEDEMYINGQPLIWDEKEQQEKDKRNRRFGDDEPYINPNRKLLKIFENYIADLAVRESFKETGE